MKAHSDFPFDLHWSVQELTDAVPLRLHQLVRFDAECVEAANIAVQAAQRRGWQQPGYANCRALPAFIRVC
ncbi:hypothetical protein ACFOLC_05025 [Lysobacter cavernae]|uniref:Uncharacterized protein n=1 Tax=Lysobacter cavernae TaxID=1685901 RepID=A0ABV7RL39_9GAMM